MAKDVKLRLLIETVDRAGKSLQQARNQLSNIRSEADATTAASKKMGTAGAASASKFSAAVGKLSEQFSKANKAADAMALAGAKLAATGAALAGVSFFPIKAAADFEQALSRVKAVTRESGKTFDDLKKRAADLGRTTQFTAVQAAEGMRFLGMAGLNTQQVFKAIGPTLDLAAAGELELGEAADYATNIMSAFGLKVEELPHIMDVLAFTAANSNTNVRQLAEAMKYAGPIASAAGVSLETAAASMATLANSGIQASMAGTSIRGILASLVKPTTEAKRALDKLDATIEKNEKGEIDLIAAMGELGKQGLLAADAFAIFRRTGASGAVTLARNADFATEFEKSLRGITTEFGSATGAARKMREEMEANLKGAWTKFTSALTGLMIVLGDQLIPRLTEVTEKITEWTTALGDYLAEHEGLASSIVVFVAGLGALLTALGAVLIPLALLVKSISILGISLLALPARIGKITASTTGMTSAFMRAGAASKVFVGGLSTLAGLGLAAVLTYTTSKLIELGGAMWEAKKAADKLRESTTKLKKTAKEMVEKYDEFKDVKIPSSSEIISKDIAQLQDMNAQLRGAQAYWQGLIIKLQMAAKETDFWGNATKEALDAQKKLETAREQWNGLNKAINQVKVQLRTATVEYEDFWQAQNREGAKVKTGGLSEEQLEVERDTQKMRIALMENGLKKIEALRQYDLAEFMRSGDAKTATETQVQERLKLINEKYGKERLDFIKKQKEDEGKAALTLSKIELDAQKEANARHLELLELQKDQGLVTTAEYYSQRAKMLKEETEAEIAILKKQLETLAADSKDLPAIKLEIGLKQKGLDDQLKILNEQQKQAQQDQLNREKELQLQLSDIQAGAIENRWAREDAYLEVDRQRAEQRMELTLQDLSQRGATETELERAKEEMKYAINEEYADKTKALWDSRIAEAASGFSDMADNLGELYEASGKKIKAFFYLQKAAAIATAIADTYLGATKAFNSMASIPYVGTALGVAAAAAAVAAGMARVAQIRQQTLASGGEVKGYSPTKRSDNIPIMATAKEFVQPVDSVQYYGKGVMEALRKKMIPRELLTGYRGIPVYVRPTRRFAEGGQVPSAARSTSMMPNAQQPGQQEIKIINYTDRSEMMAALSSGEGEQAIINVLSRNNDKVKRILR